MESWRTPAFRRDFNKAPAEIQRAAIESYTKFKANAFLPALKFKRIKKSIWCVRIISGRTLVSGEDTGWRAVGVRVNSNAIVWDFLGDHTHYAARLLKL